MQPLHDEGPLTFKQSSSYELFATSFVEMYSPTIHASLDTAWLASYWQSSPDKLG